MNWCLRGVGPHNFGAELMFLSAVAKVKEQDPETRICMDPYFAPYDWRARHGLYQLFDPTNSGRLGWLRGRLFHAGYANRYGLMRPRDIDVLLDASGYAIGDCWDIASRPMRSHIWRSLASISGQFIMQLAKPNVSSANAKRGINEAILHINLCEGC